MARREAADPLEPDAARTRVAGRAGSDAALATYSSLLEGEFREGDAVRVDARDGELALARAEAPVAEPAPAA